MLSGCRKTDRVVNLSGPMAELLIVHASHPDIQLKVALPGRGINGLLCFCERPDEDARGQQNGAEDHI